MILFEIFLFYIYLPPILFAKVYANNAIVIAPIIDSNDT